MPDPDVIAALDKKINHWNNMRTRQPMGQARWEHFKSIKADVMANPRLIAEHAAKFAAEKGRELEEKKKALRQAAALYLVNGRIEQEQLAILARQYPEFPENEILNILGARIKTRRTFTYKDDPSVVETPQIVLKPLAELLTRAGKRDLYDFLNVSPSASKNQIAAVCDDLYRRSQTSGSLADRTLNSSIVGHARNLLLSSDASRAGYDKALANAGFAPVREQMKTLAAGSAKVVAASQYSSLLQQVTRAGIPREKAEYLIFSEAEKLGLMVMDESDDTVVCRFCGSLNSKDTKSCKNCGMPLVVICPQCGNRSDNPEELRCTRCGFAIGDMSRAPEATASARRALDFGNLAEADRLIASALTAWPGYKDAEALRPKVNEAKAAAGKIEQRLRALIAEKKYYTAARELSAAGASAAGVAKEIESAVAQANEALRQAASSSDPDTRLGHYCRALEIASDCEEASRKIRMTPPSPPARVEVSVDGRNVHVEWRKSPLQFISYTVIRKADSRPSSVKDGEVIGTTQGNSIDDVNTRPGRSYYYAVYSCCGTVVSASGTTTDYPAMTVSELNPADIDFDIRERQIDFVFNAPKAVHSIEIYRDGKKIATVIGDSYRDAGLTPDTRYNYRFIAIYKDITGRSVSAQPTEMSLTPMSLPEGIDLRVEHLSDKVKLRWAAPSKGVVTVFASATPFQVSRGEKINVDTLRATPLRVSGFEAELPLNFNGVRYLLPVTVVGNVGVAGREEMVKHLTAVTGVKLSREDNRITVSWDSTKGSPVMVKWRVDGGREFTREASADDRPELNFDLPSDGRSLECILSTFVILPDGRREYGPETRSALSLKAARVEFLDFASDALFGLFGKDKFSISVRCDVVPSTDLVLILKEGSVPVDLINYNPALTIRRSELRPGETVKFNLRYSRRNSDRKLFGRLITADRQAASSVIITPESRNIK